MAQPEFNDRENEDKPLDPEVARVQAKLKRLLAGSSLVMFAGFVAVIAAIFYKINSSAPDVTTQTVAETIQIGPGAEVLDVDWSEGLMIVLVKQNGITALLRIEPATGRVLSRTEFVAR